MSYLQYNNARAEDRAATPEAARKERHLEEDIAAAILAGGWKRANALEVYLKVEALLRPSGTKGRPSKGIYLAVRPAERGRSAMNVIRGLKGIKEKSTGLTAAADDENPYENPLAVAKLVSEIDAELRGLKARVATERVLINDILLEYTVANEPTQKTATQEQHSCWMQISNACRQLMAYFKGTKVRDFKPDGGDAYWKWRSQQPLENGAEDEHGEALTPANSTVATHLNTLRAALRWYVRHHRANVRIEFVWPDFPEQETAWWTWDEVVRLLHAAMGLQWDKEKRDWKRKTAIIDGRERQVFDLLPREQRCRYRPLILFILFYFFTGTRFKRILKLRWTSNELGGCVDDITGVIWRNGRNESRTHRKPRPRSQMLEVFCKKLVILKKRDERQGIDLVIHNGTGGPVPNIRKLFNEVAQSIGLDTTPHRLKHSGVTNMAIRGFTVEQVSMLTGTTVETLRNNYLHIDWDGGIGPLEQEEFLGLRKLSDIGARTPLSGRNGRPEVPAARVRAA